MAAANGNYGKAAAILALALTLSACGLSPGAVGYLVKSPAARPVVVTTRSGPVRGVSAPEGEAFLGIPFAAPPVGSLRFRPPAPVQPWTDVRDATRAGPICIQLSMPFAKDQSEDCLTLNVYAPHDVSTRQAGHAAAPLPVMVWIYGGGFAFGSNLLYDPSRLAENEHVIVVSPNYRLGAFGFLAHPALRGPGEGAYALLDQQAALRWVRDNISAFGGDPGKVTLFGESAGAWSVCYQMTAPGARGLFQRAILESGACTSPDSAIDLPSAEAGGVKFSSDLGCGAGAEAADCLRNLPVTALRKAKAERRGLLGLNSWSAMFGGDVLPLAPRAAFEAGDFSATPMVDGTNHDEGRLFLYFNRLRGRLWTQKSYEGIVRDFFGPLTPEVLAEYAGEAGRSRGLAYADLLTDSTFACPALTLNRLVEAKAPVYAYEFDDPRALFSLPPIPFVPPVKAYHSSEISYVLQTGWIIADAHRLDPAQLALSKAMQDHWGAFARSAEPGAPEAPWPAATSGVLEFTPGMKGLATDFVQAHHCRFWNTRGY